MSESDNSNPSMQDIMTAINEIQQQQSRLEARLNLLIVNAARNWTGTCGFYGSIDACTHPVRPGNRNCDCHIYMYRHKGGSEHDDRYVDDELSLCDDEFGLC